MTDSTKEVETSTTQDFQTPTVQEIQNLKPEELRNEILVLLLLNSISLEDRKGLQALFGMVVNPIFTTNPPYLQQIKNKFLEIIQKYEQNEKFLYEFKFKTNKYQQIIPNLTDPNIHNKLTMLKYLYVRDIIGQLIPTLTQERTPMSEGTQQSLTLILNTSIKKIQQELLTTTELLTTPKVQNETEYKTLRTIINVDILKKFLSDNEILTTGTVTDDISTKPINGIIFSIYSFVLVFDKVDFTKELPYANLIEHLSVNADILSNFSPIVDKETEKKFIEPVINFLLHYIKALPNFNNITCETNDFKYKYYQIIQILYSRLYLCSRNEEYLNKIITINPTTAQQYLEFCGEKEYWNAFFTKILDIENINPFEYLKFQNSCIFKCRGIKNSLLYYVFHDKMLELLSLLPSPENFFTETKPSEEIKQWFKEIENIIPKLKNNYTMASDKSVTNINAFIQEAKKHKYNYIHIVALIMAWTDIDESPQLADLKSYIQKLNVKIMKKFRAEIEQKYSKIVQQLIPNCPEIVQPQIKEEIIPILIELKTSERITQITSIIDNLIKTWNEIMRQYNIASPYLENIAEEIKNIVKMTGYECHQDYLRDDILPHPLSLLETRDDIPSPETESNTPSSGTESEDSDNEEIELKPLLAKFNLDEKSSVMQDEGKPTSDTEKRKNRKPKKLRRKKPTPPPQQKNQTSRKKPKETLDELKKKVEEAQNFLKNKETECETITKKNTELQKQIDNIQREYSSISPLIEKKTLLELQKMVEKIKTNCDFFNNLPTRIQQSFAKQDFKTLKEGFQTNIEDFEQVKLFMDSLNTPQLRPFYHIESLVDLSAMSVSQSIQPKDHNQYFESLKKEYQKYNNYSLESMPPENIDAYEEKLKELDNVIKQIEVQLAEHQKSQQEQIELEAKLKQEREKLNEKLEKEKLITTIQEYIEECINKFEPIKTSLNKVIINMSEDDEEKKQLQSKLNNLHSQMFWNPLKIQQLFDFAILLKNRKEQEQQLYQTPLSSFLPRSLLTDLELDPNLTLEKSEDMPDTPFSMSAKPFQPQSYESQVLDLRTFQNQECAVLIIPMNSLLFPPHFAYVPQISYECLIPVRQIAPYMSPATINLQDKQYAILNCFISLPNTKQYGHANYLIPIEQYMEKILSLQQSIQKQQDKQKTGAGRGSK